MLSVLKLERNERQLENFAKLFNSENLLFFGFCFFPLLCFFSLKASGGSSEMELEIIASLTEAEWHRVEWKRTEPPHKADQLFPEEHSLK